MPSSFPRALNHLQSAPTSSIARCAQWIGLDRTLSPPEKINLYHHLAAALNLSIVILDLATLTDDDPMQIVNPDSSLPQPSSMLVVTSAQRWLSRSGTLNAAQTHRLIQKLSTAYTWIIFDLPYPIALSQVWRSWITLDLGKK